MKLSLVKIVEILPKDDWKRTEGTVARSIVGEKNRKQEHLKKGEGEEKRCDE